MKHLRLYRETGCTEKGKALLMYWLILEYGLSAVLRHSRLLDRVLQADAKFITQKG